MMKLKLGINHRKGNVVANSTNNNGGNTDYYKWKTSPFQLKDADDMIEWRGMNYAQGCIFKVAVQFNVGRHSATDEVRELNKIIHYAKRELGRPKSKQMLKSDKAVQKAGNSTS